MSKTSSNERATEWQLVINKPLENPNGFQITKYYQKLKGIYPYIAMIIHDKDKENGQLKTEHIHICIKTDRTRKETLLNAIQKILDIPLNCISIEKVFNWRKANRYLLHLDDDNKERYPPFDIFTNNEKYFYSFLQERLDIVSEQDLIEIVKTQRTTSKILLSIGADNYKKYAQIIRDLQKELI